MLMIPPTPFGLIYFLLSLIKFDTNQPNINLNVTGDGVQNANTTGGPGAPCSDDDTDMGVAEAESEEDCE